MNTPKPTPRSGDDPAHEAAAPRSRLRDIALFFAAPFISLYYAALMPVAGLRWLREQNAGPKNAGQTREPQR